jgi:PPM family protein phosphatase
MRISGFGKTHPGVVRKSNDNVILVDNDLPLYGVCDGAGGAGAGEVASGIAMQAAKAMFVKRMGEGDSTEVSAKSVALKLKAAIRYASVAVYRKSVEDSSLRGMGTSMTLVTVVDNRAVIGTVGSTKVFLLRDDVLTQMTQDHVVGQDPTVLLGDEGEGRQRGALTRTLGVCQDIEVDTYQFELLPDDRLLICNDGLRGIIESTKPYFNALRSSDEPEKIPDRLIYIANSQGGADNVSAIVINVGSDPDRIEAESQRKEETLLRIDAVRRVFLFRDLDLDELLDVAGRAVLVISRDGETIFREGEAGDAMYLIVEGRCELLKGEKLVAHLREATHFGEMSLLSNAPRSGTVVTRDRSKLLRISSEDFQEVIRIRPATGVKLLLALGKELSKRLATANDR